MEIVSFLENLDQLQSISSRNRIVRDRTHPMEKYSEEEFKRRYRFSKENTLKLLSIILPDLQCFVQSNNFIPPLDQLLTTLRFYATGNTHNTIIYIL